MKQKEKNITHRDVFRLLIVPAMFSAAMIRHPAAQWCALGILVLWIAAVLVRAAGDRRRSDLKRPKENREPENEGEEKGGTAETEHILFRQVGHRITDRLRLTYPDASWLWMKRPDAEELENGGSWRIRLCNAPPYQFGEITIADTGEMEITLIRTDPLRPPEPAEEPPEVHDVIQETVTGSGQSEAETWYSEFGAERIACMIDDLNAQGHRSLRLHEDGEVLVRSSGGEIAVDRLEWFLPRGDWKNFGTLFGEDGISVREESTGLVLSW